MYVFRSGISIGIVGIVIGIAIGTGFCYFANSNHWIKLPVGAYALDYLPFHATGADVVIVAAVTIAISFVSTILPSLNAARLNPVEALRYE